MVCHEEKVIAYRGPQKNTMFNGLYSSASALNMNLHNQDLISHNLAHVNVPGFKRSLQTVETFDDLVAANAAANQDPNQPNVSANINGANVSNFVTDFSQGRMEETGDPLNVALNGNGFFVVQGAEGPLYTRNGNFKLNQDNQLSLIGGQVVEGEGGPIQVDDVSSLKIFMDGSVSVSGQEVGKLRLVQFDQVQQLVPAGTSLFLAPPELAPQPADPADIRAQQGFVESSNTQAVNELIKMIAGMRHFEAAQKAMTTISDSIGKRTSLQSA